MMDYSREFITLAVDLNYATAAAKLNLSTSSLSRHMAELEHELGFMLFERNPLTLTPAGQFYLESISDLINNLDGIIQRGRTIGAGSPLAFCIYMLPSNSLFTQVVYESAAVLHKKHPGLSLRVCDDDRFLTTEEAVLEGKADVGFMFRLGSDQEELFECELLASLPVCAWVHKDSSLPQKGSFALEDFEHYVVPYSTNRQSKAWTDSIQKAFQESGVEFGTRLRNMEDRASFYFSLRPDEVLLDFADDESPASYNRDLVKVVFSNPVLTPVNLVYRKNSENPLVREFVAICRDVVKGRSGDFEPKP